MVAMLHPAQFAGAISLLGYFRPELGPFYDPYPRGDPLGARYDLVGLVRRSPPPVALWLETSHADGISYPSSAALLKVARPPLSIDALVLQNAGHFRSVAFGVLRQATTWLGANLSGFKATP